MSVSLFLRKAHSFIPLLTERFWSDFFSAFSSVIFLFSHSVCFNMEALLSLFSFLANKLLQCFIVMWNPVSGNCSRRAPPSALMTVNHSSTFDSNVIPSLELFPACWQQNLSCVFRVCVLLSLSLFITRKLHPDYLLLWRSSLVEKKLSQIKKMSLIFIPQCLHMGEHRVNISQISI